MLEPTYRLDERVWDGVKPCHVAAVVKSADEYTLANEFICARLAAAVGVVVPPGALATDAAGRLSYVMFDVRATDAGLQSVSPALATRANPHAVAGIVCFDCWVRNDDRHRQSVHLNAADGCLVAFDHGDALLAREGRARVAWADVEYRGGELDEYLTDARELERWADRIAGVSASLIKEICDEPVRRSMVEPDDASAIANFLDVRKTTVLGHLREDAVCANVRW